MSNSEVNNFRFQPAVISGCSSVIREHIKYELKGVALKFTPVGAEVYTLVNKANGYVDLTPAYLYLHESKEIIEIEGDEVTDAQYIIPEEGAANKQGVFFKDPDLIWLPYRI